MNQKYYGSILLVDDDPDVLAAISLLLTDEGYLVTACRDARDAMAKFHEGEFDAVLTDIVMPGVSGMKLLEDIHYLDPELPVILMTAYADLDRAVEAIKKGAFDFVIKPYKLEQLVHSIEKAVKYRRLLQMEKNYRHTLEELNQELETLIAERTMNLMALSVADKIRNPVIVISCTCRRILEKEKVSDVVKEKLKDILTEAEKLEGIVKDFQAALKGRQSIFRYEDINDVVENVISVIEKEAEQKGVELVKNLSGQPMRINMNKNLLRVAILYTIRNVIEAVPEGGRIIVATSGDGDRVLLTISGTGHGISEEDLDRIFEPFFTKKEQRFGMGLPVVKQIVSEHLGEIQVESEIDKGTTFRMTFPMRWRERHIEQTLI
jgi:signal transduction histidine kinase